MDQAVFLVGPPSCGKTNPRQALEGLGYHGLVMSDMIKARMKTDREFHQTVYCLMSQGNLVPDHMVIEVVSQNLADIQNVKYLVLDGFPRTRNQFTWLRGYLRSRGIAWTIVHIDVSDDNCRLRNDARQLEGAIRNDHKVIDSRLVAYHQSMPDMIEHLDESDEGTFIRVDGNQGMNEVRDCILSALSLRPLALFA